MFESHAYLDNLNSEIIKVLDLFGIKILNVYGATTDSGACKNGKILTVKTLE